MFSPRICKYSLGNEMIEILKRWKTVKLIKILRVSGKPGDRPYDKKSPPVAGIRQIIENLLWCCKGGMVTLGID